jgi:hypothetical protein
VPVPSDNSDVAILTFDPLVRAEPTEADRLAARNRDANLAALARTQPRLAGVIATSSPDIAWVFGRDGFLTGFEPGGGERWHGGCSVPLLAARAMLKTMGAGNGVACFLHPTHAAQVRVALEQLPPEQALICILPDARLLEILFYCEDFSAEISRGGLWFAWGESWTKELGRMLEDVPGLPTPSRFLRLPHADAASTEQIVAEAQRVFAEQNARRSAAIGEARARWTPPANGKARRVCVIARSSFRLWEDAGHTLHAAAGGGEIDLHHFDPDSPAACSPIALATSAATSDAIVAADLARADAPNIVHPDLPWVTWVTLPRIPPFAAAGPHDRLLVADPAWREAAVRAGWPAERVGVAGWPAAVAHDQPPKFPGVALIADTCGLDVPESVTEFSSHGLLWEKLRERVLRDPFAVPADVDAWVRDAARGEGIAVETLNVPTFVNRLVAPAFAQGLADALLAAGVPLKLYGNGWAHLPRFEALVGAPLTSRQQLIEAARDAAALVHPSPTAGAHPVDALGRPVVRTTGGSRASFLREVSRALQGSTPVNRCEPPLSAALLLGTLDQSPGRH